ncbi:MAG: hypothetical protein CBB82_03335 [Betaproteobacteria bacterium TMED22]|nr:MAG: hypothetical protein CBB82_03335 [Betaproteobacteria bacterium TMED22]|tara:strand:- start:4486 stop:5769 length:1284 start_codon:yes stop_codon:yes gene_type:complete
MKDVIELRRSLSDELHARAFDHFSGAGRFIRFVYFVEDNADLIVDYVNAFLENVGQAPIPRMSKFATFKLGHYSLDFEKHNEFISISFIQKSNSLAVGLLPDAYDARSVDLPLEWAQLSPGRVFHAIWLEVGGGPPEELNEQKIHQVMQARAVAANQFSDGAAQVYFAFDIDSAGFSRVALFNSNMVASRLGRAVQRIVELETYRLLALLGFATVKEHSAKLDSIAKHVGEITNELAEQIKQPESNVEDMLSKLSAQAADLENIYSNASYRMAATKAYDSIVENRLDGLRVSRIEGFQGVKGFLNRRMLPAIDSCRAFSERLRRLSERISRAGDLLQTQTEMIIQRQNQDLLISMNSRAKTQLRLQQTVERLSIAAVTYYGVGLVGFAGASLPLVAWGLNLDVLKAISIPIIAGCVWLTIRQVKRRI